MTDIVERLRDASYENAPSRCMEAAREIERLRALQSEPVQPAGKGEITDEVVERAWAAIVGKDIAKDCYQASIIRADLRDALVAVRPEAPAGVRDYTAWLIEISEGSGPSYFQLEYDNDWTTDHDAALHFSRKQDAEKAIAYYGWTSAKASEHCWPEPRVREVIAESNGHHWIKALRLVCCRDCGIVRRADDQNKPCKGTVRIGPRALPSDPVRRTTQGESK